MLCPEAESKKWYDTYEIRLAAGTAFVAGVAALALHTGPARVFRALLAPLRRAVHRPLGPLRHGGHADRRPLDPRPLPRRPPPPSPRPDPRGGATVLREGDGRPNCSRVGDESAPPPPARGASAAAEGRKDAGLLRRDAHRHSR